MMNQVIVNTQMKNQIIFKQIDDLEAILTCEYIIQDGIVRCGQKTIGTFVNYERYQSRLFTERDANGISWRVKRWLERRLNRELKSLFEFCDELLFFRKQIATSNSANKRLLLERLMITWRAQELDLLSRPA